MAACRAQIAIKIVYAQPQRSIVKSLNMAAGALIADALSLLSRDADFSGIDLLNSPVGIFGKSARKDQQLKEGDRIEIYRQVAQEPKLARRTRAAAVKAPRAPRR